MQKELPLESCFHLKLPIDLGNKIKFNEPYLQLIKARIIFQRFLDLTQCTELVILDADRVLVSVGAAASIYFQKY